MFYLAGSIPRHHYVWIDSTFIYKTSELGSEVFSNRFIPAVWYGLESYPGRCWGLDVHLANGALYRNLPSHAIAFSDSPEANLWLPNQAQTWDCYGTTFTAFEDKYLSGLRCMALCAGQKEYGHYLFTVAPYGDGFSAYPEQAKQFMFIQLDNGRLTIQPTNHLILEDKSFTELDPDITKWEFPKGLVRQIDVYSAE